jgi:hypothetical protein
MDSLLDFLNHGILPFVGRTAESARIIDFWRGTFDAYRLRIALLTGEAGIGKSRLIEEIIPRMVAVGGAVVHTRLYAESATSLVPLVARALWHPDAGRSLLAKEPEGMLGSVASALRRLSRLRATLLVVEDIHLLGGDALREFSQLLHAISEENISVLCLGRPVEMEARPVLEPCLIDEIELRGLTGDDYRNLWERMMGMAAEPEVTTALYEATAGNPLALRSALRGAIKAETVRREARSNTWRMTSSVQVFSNTLKQNVGLLAEGMTVHLSEEEKGAARQLACLGELFSREAAEEMVENAERIIESLTFAGIIAQAGSAATSLVGTTSNHPVLAFSHTLLHRRLLEGATIDPRRLLRVVGRQLPFYSTLPFQLLCRQFTYAGGKLEYDREAVNVAISVAVALDATPDWRLKDIPLLAAASLIERRKGEWGPEEGSDLELKLLEARLRTSHREPYRVQRPLIDELLERTGEPRSLPLAAIRVATFGIQILNDPATRTEAWQEVDALLARFPGLISHSFYASFLNDTGSSLIVTGNYDDGDMRAFEQRIADALAIEDLPEAVHEKILLASTFTLLTNAETSEELRRQLTRIGELEAYSERVKVRAMVIRADRLMNMGLFDLYIEDMEWALAYYRDLAYDGYITAATAALISARAAYADDLGLSEREAEECLMKVLPNEVALWRRYLGINLITYAFLRGEPGHARRLAQEYSEGLRSLPPLLCSILGMSDGDLEQSSRQALDDNPTVAALKSLTRFILARADNPGEALRSARVLLGRGLLRIYDLLYIHATMDLLSRLSGKAVQDQILQPLRKEIHEALLGVLEWLAEPGRELYPFMAPFLERYPGYFTAREIDQWRIRIGAIRNSREQRTQEAAGGDGRIRLSMLGTVSARKPGDKVRRFQGARIRQLLGVMVASQMLEHPLSTIEFRRVTIGEESDMENARNMVKNTVHRTREILGHDALLTDGETPRLNFQLVRVDLLDVHQLLTKARDALRSRSPMQAKQSLIEALRITNGEVAFPSLYDEFFEAAREQFELELREATIDVVTELLREGAASDSEEVLHRACNGMPGDEELAELLADSLARQGKHLEAERVRMKVAEAAWND